MEEVNEDVSNESWAHMDHIFNHILEEKQEDSSNEDKNEPMEISEELFIQVILKAAEETEDPQLNLELLNHAMDIQDKYESICASYFGRPIFDVEMEQLDNLDDFHNNSVDENGHES
ncbi:hypothetical protein KI387_037800, partial [Taxus chinensis]